MRYFLIVAFAMVFTVPTLSASPAIASFPRAAWQEEAAAGQARSTAGQAESAATHAESTATQAESTAAEAESTAGPEQEAPTDMRPVPDSLDGLPYGALPGSRVTLYFAPQDSLVALRVQELLTNQAALPGLPSDAPTGVHALLAHSPEAFDEMTGSVVPEWRAGVAIPSIRTLVMPTGESVRVLDGEGLRTLRHEWAHLGLHDYMGDLRIPRWFNEGYAQWASGGFDVSESWRLRLLIATNRAPSMDSLALGWPRDRGEAQAAYLLAASAVTWLLESGGEEGLRIFLDRWKEQRSFESAFRETFGLTVGQFEEDWKRHVKDRYGWLFVISRSSVFWMALALVLLFMVRGRQSYNRQKLAKLRAGEEPDAPAYWNADDDDLNRPSGVGVDHD